MSLVPRLLRTAAFASLCAVAAAGAQTPVAVTDLGPGRSGRLLTEALARPHRLIEPDTSWFVLGRGETERGTLIVLGRTAAISGNVEGDVIVVAGDLFVRPGARIDGRAIAIGGGIYPSTLAYIRGESESFRDNTFSITRTGQGYELAYQSLREGASPPLLFPGIYGLRAPSYDRVNGLSLSFGPAFSIDTGRGEVNVRATYRSDLGKIDPFADGEFQISRRLRATASAGRGTFTNDAWIWGNLTNTLSAFALGTDTRNYYRADRAEARLYRLWETKSFVIEPFVGALTEKAWSVGPAVGERRGPWSITGRSDSLGMWRPNPAVTSGRISSGLAGAHVDWHANDLSVTTATTAEFSLSTPDTGRFVQVTSDFAAGFPTFGEQSYAMDVHWVTTVGDAPPPQRFAYIGGSGTLPFIDLLSEGGDELLLIDQRYSVPLPNLRFGILGEPTLLLRHRIGSAGLGKLARLEQMIGAGVMLTVVRAELLVDPSRRKLRLALGFTFSR